MSKKEDIDSSSLDPFNEGIEGKGKYYPMVVLTNKKLLIDDSFADLTIKVGSDSVSAHAPIVACRCEELLAMPSADEKKKRKKHEVRVKGVTSVQIMQKVLEYLYTGMVDFPKLTDAEILQLNAAARQFKLARLGYLCERWLREHMSIESVFHLLRAATDANEARVKGFCVQFALQHYNEFISNKDGIYILGIELFQEVVTAFQTNPPAPEEISPANAPPDTLLDDFRRMYEQMPFCDITLTIDGEQIKCHKAILGAHSDVFVQTLFKEGSQPQGRERVSAAAFSCMLRFVYYGDDNIPAQPAVELVEFSRRYKLHSLLRICEDKVRNSIATDTVLDILSIAYLPGMAQQKPDLVEELQKKAVPFLLEHLSEVDLRKMRTYADPTIALDILLKIQDAWRRGDYGLGSDGDSGSHESHHSSKKSGSSSSSKKEEGGFSLGAQRRPAPPPREGRGNTNPAPVSNLPPPVIGGNGPPQPPPRDKPRDPAAPPNFPPPPTTPTSDDVTTPKGSARGKGEDPKRLSKRSTSKKSLHDVSEAGGKKKTSKKEEEKKKKEEQKRIAKEKKEREKMEKRFKSSKAKSKDLF